MRKFVRIISILMMIIICISAVSCGGEGDETTMNDPQTNVNVGTKVGDKITLGSYEQNGDASAKEPITWTVIKVEEGRALLLADYCLSHTKFHEAYEEFTWEDCDMRDKLNKDFYLTAFTEEEKALIDNVTLDNGENYIFAVGEGNDTKDSVFLLSLEEARELLTEDIIKGVPTEALKKSADLTHGKTSCNWWLRTQGSTAATVQLISSFSYLPTITLSPTFAPPIFSNATGAAIGAAFVSVLYHTQGLTPASAISPRRPG